jgi:hypothetical protein
MSVSVATGSTSQQTAALNQLLSKYKTDLSQGQPASTLQSIARQIASDARGLGQTVTLPKGPEAAAAPSAGTGRLNTVA